MTFCVVAARADTPLRVPVVVADVVPRFTVVRPVVAARAVTFDAELVARGAVALRAVVALRAATVFVRVDVPDVAAETDDADWPRRCWGAAAYTTPHASKPTKHSTDNRFITGYPHMFQPDLAMIYIPGARFLDLHNFAHVYTDDTPSFPN